MTIDNNVYFSKISNEVTEFNHNKNPIRMDLFLSFLTVNVTRSTEHLGACNGWTELRGENNLQISGGIINGVEYLNNIKYMQNLHNAYNNYVNPFYIFDLLTDEGKQFFVDYCKTDIDKIINEANNRLEAAKKQLESAIDNQAKVSAFWEPIQSKGTK